jgi:peroxiredoxin
MRADLAPGNRFPDLRLPEHTGEELSLSEIASGQPLLLCFVRGWWCPKEQVRVRMLVDMQEELQREYGKVAAVTVDGPYVNGAFRAGIGAHFPFLSDEERRVARELDLLEETDAKHRPFLPFTFLLDSLLVVRQVWCGFWFWGNPTPEELRQGLRAITRDEQPSFEPQRTWREGATGGIEAPLVFVREDGEGREIQRGAFEGEVPELGQPVGGEGVDGRPWLLHAVEDGELRLRKPAKPDPSPLVRHHVTAPR